MIRGSGSVVCADHHGNPGSQADIPEGLKVDVPGGPGAEVYVPAAAMGARADVPGGPGARADVLVGPGAGAFVPGGLGA